MRRAMSPCRTVAPAPRDRLVGGGEPRIPERLPHARRPAVRQVGGGGVGPLRQGEGGACPLPLDDLAHRKAVARIGDGRGEDFGQLHRSEALEQLVPGVDRAGHGPRERAVPRHSLVSLPDQRFATDLVRRAAGPVQAVQTLGLGVPDEGEQVSADAVHVRLHQPQHGVDGDRGVDGVPARLQDVDADLRRERLARRHHPVRGDHLRAAAVRAAGGPAVAVPERLLRLGAQRSDPEHRDSDRCGHRLERNPTALPRRPTSSQLRHLLAPSRFRSAPRHRDNTRRYPDPGPDEDPLRAGTARAVDGQRPPSSARGHGDPKRIPPDALPLARSTAVSFGAPRSTTAPRPRRRRGRRDEGAATASARRHLPAHLPVAGPRARANGAIEGQVLRFVAPREGAGPLQRIVDREQEQPEGGHHRAGVEGAASSGTGSPPPAGRPAPASRPYSAGSRPPRGNRASEATASRPAGTGTAAIGLPRTGR